MDAISLAKEDEPDFDHAKFENAARLIHQKKKFEPDMMADDAVRNLTGETYRVLASAISREVPDELKAYLKENTFIFSGFKTYHELKEASALLQDDNGGFKSFESFFKDIRHIDSQYNRNYLNAEYKFAVQSAQMAAKWNDFEKDGDRYLLQYRTASDDRVRPEHAALNGTTLPIDDPFWNSYLPPLDWGCRCTAVQVRKDKYPVSNSHEACAAGDRATALPKQKIFRFNPGKDKKIFPPKHPYLPKGCKNCDKGLKLAFDGNKECCQVCLLLAQLKNKELLEKVSKQEANSARQLALEWADRHLQSVKVGKDIAKRLTIISKDHNPIIVNKSFFSETFAKNRNNRFIVETMQLTTEVSEWLPLATKIATENGIHHDFNFDVYDVSYKGIHIVCKVKKTEADFLYMMRIEKES